MVREIDRIHTHLRRSHSIFDALYPFQSDREIRMSSQPSDIIPIQLRINKPANRSTNPASSVIRRDLPATNARCLAHRHHQDSGPGSGEWLTTSTSARLLSSASRFPGAAASTVTKMAFIPMLLIFESRDSVFGRFRST